MDIYLIIFLVLVLTGSITIYSYYLKEKKAELDSIRRGYCPTCHQNTIEMVDQRGTGCGSPRLVSYECSSCGYHNSFSIDGGSCGL